MGDSHIPGTRISGGARSRTLRIGAPLVVLSVALATASIQTADAAPSAASHTLVAVGSVAPAPAGAETAPAPSDSTTIDVDVALQPRNADELSRYAELVSDPKSPFYKQYLTKEQVQLLFAPTQSTVDNVTAALRAQGLNPRAAVDDGLYIPVTATVSTLKRAFRVGFTGYRLADGRRAFNATAVPKLDGSVASAVRGVVGLDDFMQPDVQYRAAGGHGKRANISPAAVASQSSAAHRNGAVPALCSSLTTTIDAYLTQNGYTGKDGGTYYSPTALASAYGYVKRLESGDDGQGVSVAVEEWEAPDRQAISEYENCVGSHSKVSYVFDGSGTPVQPTPDNYVGVETAIDTEAVAAVAPLASIIDYEGSDYDNTFTDADWLENFAKPVSDDIASAISISWLIGCESGPVDSSLENSQTTTLELAALQGQSVFAASGDNGSEGCAEPQLNVSDPADNAWLTAVGGTYMQGLTNPTITPWNDSFDTSATEGIGLLDNGGATGGGVSTLHSFPSEWNYQAGFIAPGYSDVCGAASGQYCRQVPDLSLDGDWRSGFPLIYYADSSGYDVLMVAGTSLATPILAAITALADSSAKCAATGPAGFINPLIYDLARDPATYAATFNDETTGNNAYIPSGYTGSLYQAAKGYDMASGLGSPKAQTLIPALCTGAAWPGGWHVGRNRLGEAAQQGQASVDEAITAEKAEAAGKR
ncbi:S53 family peptidase [Actinospica sp. MGRD01-02]|uniref:S53 family peptidase n=1 Tax=Actinospica acidithermotolerans TaxID=2828514 RepID=A0A941IJF0_9ACTN|nr:S53 family peptidase [Actinospica acidithermotolerans]MBR7830685.1 S53 family peptidase [Actinospica acidithermotolerans]